MNSQEKQTLYESFKTAVEGKEYELALAIVEKAYLGFYYEQHDKLLWKKLGNNEKDKFDKIFGEASKYLDEIIKRSIDIGIRNFEAGKIENPERVFEYIWSTIKRSISKRISTSFSIHIDEWEDNQIGTELDLDQPYSFVWNEKSIVIAKLSLNEVKAICREVLSWIVGSEEVLIDKLVGIKLKTKFKTPFGKFKALAGELLLMNYEKAYACHLWTVFKQFKLNNYKGWSDIEKIQAWLRQETKRCSEHLFVTYHQNLKMLKHNPHEN